MNKTLQEFARKTLVEGLNSLPSENRRIFALLYARNNGKRSVDEAYAMSVEQIVEGMPEDKLDWAMRQVENTIEKNAKKVAP